MYYIVYYGMHNFITCIRIIHEEICAEDQQNILLDHRKILLKYGCNVLRCSLAQHSSPSQCLIYTPSEPQKPLFFKSTILQ